ncbi:MAG: hypothetical protein ACXVJN_16440 [Mucilaginibacter sp.]
MDDQLDNDLKNRIREVFENFEDEHADEGWLLLREKYPEKAKRRPAAWLWWGSVAALLLVVLGLLWFKYTPVTEQHYSANKKSPAPISAPKADENKKNSDTADSAMSGQQNQNIAENIDHTNDSKKNNNATDNTVPGQQKQNLAENIDHTTVTNKIKNSAVPVSAASSLQTQKLADNTDRTNHPLKSQVNPANQQLSVPPVSRKQNDINSPNAATTLAAVSQQPKNPGQTTAINQTNIIAKVDTGNKAVVRSLTAVTRPGINMQDQVSKSKKPLFSDDEVKSDNTTRKPTNGDKTVRFAVYAATYFNYAKGSDNQLNVGAGFTSDIKLSKNLKFSTGVAIAQNTLNYTNQPPVNTQSAAPVAVTNYYLAASSIYTAAAPAFKNYNASLIGLDIPLNLKYEFNPQKGDTYISAGLSSGTFINETYTYSYNNPAPFSATISQVQDQSTRKSFDSFYFGKTLNFSFGTGYSVGRNLLIIEPFLKYPLEGLGAQQIRFGAGGLNLKFNFQNQKK